MKFRLRSQGGKARRYFPPRQNLNVSIDYQLKLCYFVLISMPKKKNKEKKIKKNNPSTSLIIVTKTWIEDRLPVLFSSGNSYKQYKQSLFADKAVPTFEHFASIVTTTNLSKH